MIYKDKIDMWRVELLHGETHYFADLKDVLQSVALTWANTDDKPRRCNIASPDAAFWENKEGAVIISAERMKGVIHRKPTHF